MKKIDINVIIKNMDKLNLDQINNDEKELLNQANQTIFIITDKLARQQYDQEIIDQFILLITKINQALITYEKYNLNILLFTIQNSLKLLYSFDQIKALTIWNKFFVNNLIKNNEPEFIFNINKLKGK